MLSAFLKGFVQKHLLGFRNDFLYDMLLGFLQKIAESQNFFSNTFNDAYKMFSCIFERVAPKFSPEHHPSKPLFPHILLSNIWKGPWFCSVFIWIFLQTFVREFPKEFSQKSTKKFQTIFPTFFSINHTFF